MESELSKAERDRYRDQLALARFGERRQRQLKQSRVLVIGAGPLGATAAGQLASVGVGYLGVVDRGKVAPSDLASQTVALSPDVGTGRADSLAAKLGLLNPEVQLDAYPVELDEQNVDAIVVGHDLVVSCISDTGARLAINDSCVAAGIPLIDCVMRGDRAAIQPVHPEHGCCLRCSGVESNAKAGAAPGLAGVAGAVAATEAVAALVGETTPAAGRIEIGSAPVSISIVDLERSQDCPTCNVPETAEVTR